MIYIDDSCIFDSIMYDTIDMEFYPWNWNTVYRLSIVRILVLAFVSSIHTAILNLFTGFRAWLLTLITNLITIRVTCFTSDISIIHLSSNWDLWLWLVADLLILLHSYKYIECGTIHGRILSGWDDHQISLFAWYDSLFAWYPRVRFFDTFIHCRTVRHPQSTIIF